MRNQQSFNPIDYTFQWTGEDETGWYEWDRTEAHKQALKARNAEAKRLRAKGHKVRCGTHRDQLMSRGGIGSGRPHIELHVNCYYLNVIS